MIELDNKTVIAIPFVLCLISGLAILSPTSTLPANVQNHSTKTMHSDMPSFIMTKLSLSLDKTNTYLEQKLGIRNSEWIAGPAKPVP